MDTNQSNMPATPTSTPRSYAARLTIDYPEKLDRLTTFFRLLWFIPIGIIFGLVAGAGQAVHYTTYLNTAGQVIDRTRDTSGGIVSGILVATALMILFQQVYPRWWFDFEREMTRFAYRVSAYLALLTDRYPSTVEEQSIHLEIDYPDVKNNLNRWLPLFKWLLAIPHYIILAFLAGFAVLMVIFAWFAILLTGKFPRSIFDYVVGVGRWGLRVYAYAFLMVTDEYPPFSLD